MLSEVGEVRVRGRRPVERLRKKWSECVMEEMDCWEWKSMWRRINRCGKQLSPAQSHPRWEIPMLNENDDDVLLRFFHTF